MSKTVATPTWKLLASIAPAVLFAFPSAAALHKRIAVPIVRRAVGFGQSQRVRDMAVAGGSHVDEQREAPSGIEHGMVRGVREVLKETPGGVVTASVGLPRSLAMPAPSLTFDGLTAADFTTIFGGPSAPPSSSGAVGPNDYVQVTQSIARIFDKNGVPRGPAFKLSSLFASTGGICSTHDDGSGVVLYDRMANRWLISQNAFTGVTTPPYHQCIAVSKSGDPTGAYFAYDYALPGNEFNDHVRFGTWPDAYYMSDMQFTNGAAFNGYGVFAFDRTKMLAGDPTAGLVYFNMSSLAATSFPLTPSDFNGLTPPPAAAPNVFAGYTDNNFGDPADALRLFNFHVDFGVPANSTFLERSESPLGVAAFDSRNPPGRADIEQPAPATGTDNLDSNAISLMPPLQYMNRGGTETLVVTHTVNASGVTPNTAANYRAAIRYYMLQKTTPGGSYSVPEQSTFSPDTNERWTGSAAIDNAGDLAVGYSISSTSINPSIAYAGRLAADAANSLAQGEATMFSGTGVQRSTANRWGDFSTMSLDPSDDATFWYTNEYYNTTTLTFNWRTRIGRFKFANIMAPPQGTLSGTITTCDNGLPLADALVQVSGGPSTGFSTGTLNGTYSLNLSPGTYSVTITNPSHNCIGIGPSSVTITNGGTTTFNACLSGTPKFAIASTAISGGNGDGVIERDECNNLNVSLLNVGCGTASGVTAVLSTSTPNVTIAQPNTTFPTMSEGATGAAQFPFTVSTSPAFVCGTPIAFTLTITTSAGGSTVTFTIPTCAAPPVTISGSITSGDLQQTARLGRNGIVSACGTAKVCPGTIGLGFRSYDLYSFTNGPTAACVTIATTASCPVATNPILTSAYLGSFNPSNLCTNYLGDDGVSLATTSFDVNVPANGTLLVNVAEVNAATGCSAYTVTVSGLVANTTGGGQCPALSPPTITKAFGAPTMANGSPTSLTFTLTNPNSSIALSGVGFTDTLPAGLVVATPNALNNGCNGTVLATSGSGTISLSGGIIAAGSSCTTVVNVMATTLGVKNNATGPVSSANGGTGATSNTATVTVLSVPTIAKAFGTSTLPNNTTGITTSLTFTLTNPNSTAALTGVAFTDTLPAGLVVATPNGLTNTCSGAVLAVSGSGTISLSGGTIAPASSCTTVVNVTATTSGVKNNTTGPVSSTNGGTGATSNTATVNVTTTDIPIFDRWTLLLLIAVLTLTGAILSRKVS